MSDAAAPWVTRLGQRLLDLFFPPHCLACQRPGSWLCPSCLQEAERVKDPSCPRCGRPTNSPDPCPICYGRVHALESVRAPFFFEETIRRAVHELKYRGRRVLAEPLGALLAPYLAGLAWPVSTIMPVPLHRQRERARGYNQAALLARVLAVWSRWPLDEVGLVRVRNTPPQVGLDGAARRENVRGAFAWKKETPPPVHVLLVDDVYTTGATMEAAAEALVEAGAQEVRGMAVARPKGEM